MNIHLGKPLTYEIPPKLNPLDETHHHSHQCIEALTNVDFAIILKPMFARMFKVYASRFKRIEGEEKKKKKKKKWNEHTHLQHTTHFVAVLS